MTDYDFELPYEGSGRLINIINQSIQDEFLAAEELRLKNNPPKKRKSTGKISKKSNNSSSKKK